jgi:chemotaxis signal transduction protein
MKSAANLPLENDLYQLIVINDQQYALPVHCITTVLALENILRLPGTASWLSGVVHVRNAIVPVININKLIEVDDPAHQSNCQLLVLLHHPLDSQRLLGISVTDLTILIYPSELAEMASSSSTHQCLIDSVNDDSQQIHLLDIANLFEQLLQGQN